METTKIKYTIKVAGVIFIFISIMLSTPVLHAQTIAVNSDLENILTEQQKELLKNERELIKKHRYEFRKTLTDVQIKIIKDQTKTKEEKRLLLEKTFNKEQKKILTDHEKRIEKKRMEFRHSLTNEQKEVIRESYQLKEGINTSKDLKNDPRSIKNEDIRYKGKESGNQGGKG